MPEQGVPAIPGVTRWRRQGTIEAVQITADADWEAVAAWCGGTLRNREMGDSGEYETVITVPAAFPEGTREAFEDWWVVRLAEADLLMYPPDVFAATYEPAPAPLVMPQDEFDALKAVAEAAAVTRLCPTCLHDGVLERTLERARAAEARLAAIAGHVRDRLNAPGRAGMTRAAAGLILGIAEGSSEKETRDG